MAAFGLDLDPVFGLPGFGHETGDRTGRALRLTLAREDELRRRAASAPPTRIAEVLGDDGTAWLAVDAAGSDGFLLSGRGFGTFWIDAGGGHCECAPAALPAWQWQRFLSGQVLPFAAVLHGFEVFHASAVVIDGRAIAVVAASGIGKTSVACELVLRGASFMADDALVLEPEPGGVLAHPAAALANVARDAGDLPERLERAGAGTALGTSGDEVRVALARHEQPAPLTTLFYLERTRSAGSLRVERVAPVDPRLLLASTFNLALRDPARLARQLDMCGRVAESCTLYRIACPPSVGAREVAESLHEQMAAVEVLSS